MTVASALASTEWLARHLQTPDIRVVDATWFLPTVDHEPRAEFEGAHVPGAVFFDIDEIADDRSDLPHMLPGAEKFASRVRKLGLGDGNRIVVYDNNRLCASARVWWMFRHFGHDDVSVLDGGLGKWRAEDRPLDNSPVSGRERHFTPRLNSLLVRELDDLRQNVTSRREQVVDVRSAGRFFGTEPEPRSGLRSGHIPGSINLPHSRLIADDGTLRDTASLREIFTSAGVSIESPIVTSCGSGVTAAVAALALFEIGAREVAVYDGSWSEWGGRSDTPVAC